MPPAWVELVAGIVILFIGVWRGNAEVDKVGNPVPEGYREDLTSAAEYREGWVDRGCLWVTGGILVGGGTAVHSIGRMVFGW